MKATKLRDIQQHHIATQYSGSELHQNLYIFDSQQGAVYKSLRSSSLSLLLWRVDLN